MFVKLNYLFVYNDHHDMFILCKMLTLEANYVGLRLINVVVVVVVVVVYHI